MMVKKRSKYQKEILKIEELQELDRIMKKEEIEGMLLSNPSRESETVNDSIVDRILSKFKLNRNDVKKLDMIERQTMGEGPVKPKLGHRLSFFGRARASLGNSIKHGAKGRGKATVRKAAKKAVTRSRIKKEKPKRSKKSQYRHSGAKGARNKRPTSSKARHKR